MITIKAQTLRPDSTIKPSMVRIKDGVIQSVATIPLNQCETDKLLCPGMIDIQVNGAGGELFNQNPDVVTLATIGDTIAAFGTTGWLPTLVTDSTEKMKQAADAVSQGVQDPKSGVKGIHFEGPHLSVAKRGVHHPDHIRSITEDEMAIYQRNDLGVKLLTIAPEQVSAEQIRELVSAGCIVSIGHSNTDYQTTHDAIEAGATCFTHLYNAMSGMSGREPGVIAAALESQQFYGIIMDGIHVHEAMVRMAYNQNNHMILVTDAMPPVGTNNASFEWYGQTIHRQDDRLVDDNGTLAGAFLTQNQALANAMLMLRLSLDDVLPLVTTNPARLLRLSHSHALIEPGCVADLMLIDETAEVQTVWRSGHEI